MNRDRPYQPRKYSAMFRRKACEIAETIDVLTLAGNDVLSTPKGELYKSATTSQEVPSKRRNFPYIPSTERCPLFKANAAAKPAASRHPSIRIDADWENRFNKFMVL